jgi:hypothetical protein
MLLCIVVFFSINQSTKGQEKDWLMNQLGNVGSNNKLGTVS